MDERERQIRELINNPGFPSGRITEQQVSNAMAGDMRDGSLDRAAAEEMRRKIADQLFMEMRLRGEGKYNGLRAASPGRPEDTSYAKADSVAAQGLGLQRGSVQRELDRRATAPAAYDPGRADFREIQQLGIPAGENDFGGLEQEQADELYLKRLAPPSRAMSPGEDGIMWPYPSNWEAEDLPAGGPISWEEARVIRSKALRRESDKQARRVNDFHAPGREVKHPSELNYGPRREYVPQADPGGDYKPDISRFTGAASPRQPAYDTTTRSSADLDVQAQAEAAAAAIMARQRAARRGNK